MLLFAQKGNSSESDQSPVRADSPGTPVFNPQFRGLRANIKTSTPPPPADAPTVTGRRNVLMRSNSTGILDVGKALKARQAKV